MISTSLLMFGVVGHPLRLVGRVEAALQPRVVGGDAGGTGVPVALQRLDAAEREHEAAGAIDEIGAGAQRPGDSAGVISLPEAITWIRSRRPCRLRMSTTSGRLRAAAGRHCRSGLRRGAGAAVGAVDGDEIGRAVPAAPVDLVAQLVEPAIGADDALKPTGLPVTVANTGDASPAVRRSLPMSGCRLGDRVLARRNAADRGDFGGDLDARQDAALAGLRALRA